jgi:predicted ATP-grasp superfamily ATP-dependent carboligase
VTVLVLGTGVTVLGTLRTLGRAGMAGLALPEGDPLVRRSRWFRPAPAALAGLSPDRLPEALRVLPEGTVLLPCSDRWTLAVAALPEPLRRRWPASVASVPVLEALVDKRRLAQELEARQVPGPRTVAPLSRAVLRELPDDLIAGAFLKPADSQSFFARFGVKAFAVTGRVEAEERLARCEAAGLTMILQEYVPGPASNHYYVEGFRDRTGAFRAWFARRRLRMYPPDFGNSTLMISVPIEEVIEAQRGVERLLSDLGYRGIFSAEWKRDARTGVLKLLEINCRPWWYVEFAARCGVDVCSRAVRDAEELPVEDVAGYSIGRRCVYPYYDLAALRESGRLGRGLLDWIGAEPPIFRWSDPMPALSRAGAWLTRRIR